MNADFQIHALDESTFSDFFSMTNTELSSVGAYLFKADECPCYPCRVSLTDATIGERVLAISHEHHSANSPYKSAGPIFIRENAQKAKLKVNEIPHMLRHRQLSIRGYNAEALMIEADIVAGDNLERVLSNQLNNVLVEYIHIHNAGPGCFNCEVRRMFRFLPTSKVFEYYA